MSTEPSLEPSPKPTVREPSLIAPTSSSRPRDLIYEILFHLETGKQYTLEANQELTRSASGTLNQAVLQVKETGIDPVELLEAIEAYPELRWDKPLTASSLAKHLPRLRAAARGMVALGTPRDSVEGMTARAMASLEKMEESW